MMKAKDLYDAKCKAIEYFKVPKSKTNLVAVEPGYEDDGICVGWFAFYNQKKVAIMREYLV
jgi:hypothetical protein